LVYGQINCAKNCTNLIVFCSSVVCSCFLLVFAFPIFLNIYPIEVGLEKFILLVGGSLKRFEVCAGSLNGVKCSLGSLLFELVAGKRFSVCFQI
jgi:hypothetical protein